MTAKEFRRECEGRMLGRLYDADLNPEYNVQITLSVSEMREIDKAMRKCERQNLIKEQSKISTKMLR